MKTFFSLLGLFAILSFTVSFQPIANNSIKGTIEFKDCPSKFKKGTGYNTDGTEVMHSDDAMATIKMNIVVSLHPLTFKPKLKPTKNARITQREQTFLPKVLPVTLGSKVHFLNEDEFFHNVRSETHRAKFSIGKRAPGISYSRKIKKKGVISLMCNIHSHMNGIILSLDTPYFTRMKKDGSFQINNLPDGKYRLEIYHPNCNKITDEVEIKEGKVNTLKYSFKRP